MSRKCMLASVPGYSMVKFMCGLNWIQIVEEVVYFAFLYYDDDHCPHTSSSMGKVWVIFDLMPDLQIIPYRCLQ